VIIYVVAGGVLLCRDVGRDEHFRQHLQCRPLREVRTEKQPIHVGAKHAYDLCAMIKGDCLLLTKLRIT